MDTIAQIKIEKLVFPNEDKPTLKNIDFEIDKGDFIVITGGVAAGKSVLLHSITGAIPHYHNAELTGKVTIMGNDIKGRSLNSMSDYVGYMMQEPQNQLINLDVYEDVAFGLCNMGMPLMEIDKRVKDTLELVGLKGFEKRQTSSLSGGQAQRVVLAGVLALNAPILVLDQPSAELDPQGRHELYKRLGQLNKVTGLTVVLVMDRIEEVITYANRVFYMENGEITKQYTPVEYCKERNEQLKKRLKINHLLNAENSRTNEVIAEVKDASYHYKDNLVGCLDINLEIHRGDFISVVGLNGSGKSTLAKLLIGLLKPSKGEIKVFSLPLDRVSVSRVLLNTGFLFQNPDYQIFASTLEEEAGFSLKLRGESKEVIDRKVDECLQFVGLLSYKTMHPQRLSRGQRQLLALASILVSDPEFIIADEPTSGLDENQGYMVMDKLKSLSQKGKTVLLITHDLTMVKNYSNRLVAMHNHHIKLDIPTGSLDKYIDALKEIGLDFKNIISFEEV